METSGTHRWWSWRKAILVAVAVGAVIAVGLLVAASGGSGSGGIY
jgi:hypothetical protein